MPRAMSVFVCVGLAGCGRIGFAPRADDASAADAPTGDGPAADAPASHVSFAMGSAVAAGGAASNLQAEVGVAAGDLILVGTSFDTMTTSAVAVTLTDSFGDGYSTVSGPLDGSDNGGQGFHQRVSAAAAGSAGTLTVSAAIGSASYDYFELFVVTYRGTATLPFGNGLAQVQAQGTGIGTTDPIATTSAGALIVAYIVGLDASVAVEPGSTECASIMNDVIQDTAVPAPGDVPVSFAFTSFGAGAEWVVTAIVLN